MAVGSMTTAVVNQTLPATATASRGGCSLRQQTAGHTGASHGGHGHPHRSPVHSSRTAPGITAGTAGSTAHAPRVPSPSSSVNHPNRHHYHYRGESTASAAAAPTASDSDTGSVIVKEEGSYVERIPGYAQRRRSDGDDGEEETSSSDETAPGEAATASRRRRGQSAAALPSRYYSASAGAVEGGAAPPPLSMYAAATSAYAWMGGAVSYMWRGRQQQSTSGGKFFRLSYCGDGVESLQA